MPKHIVRLLYQSHFSFLPISSSSSCSSFSCWLAVLRLFSLSFSSSFFFLFFFRSATIHPICQYEGWRKKRERTRERERERARTERRRKLLKRQGHRKRWKFEREDEWQVPEEETKTTSTKRWINQTMNSFRQYIC